MKINTEVDFQLMTFLSRNSFSWFEKIQLGFKKNKIQKDFEPSLNYIKSETKRLIEPYLIKILKDFKQKEIKIRINFDVFFNVQKEVNEINIDFFVLTNKLSSFIKFEGQYVYEIKIAFDNSKNKNEQIIDKLSFYFNLLKEDNCFLSLDVWNKKHVGNKYSNCFIRFINKFNLDSLFYSSENFFMKRCSENVFQHYKATNSLISMMLKSPILVEPYGKYEFSTIYNLYPNRVSYVYRINDKRISEKYATYYDGKQRYKEMENTELGIIDGFINSEFLSPMFRDFIIENGSISKEEFIGLAEVSKIIEY